MRKMEKKEEDSLVCSCKRNGDGRCAWEAIMRYGKDTLPTTTSYKIGSANGQFLTHVNGPCHETKSNGLENC